MKKAACFGAMVAGCLSVGGVAEAAEIYVLRDPDMPTYLVQLPINHLRSLGHTVTDGTAVHTDYSAYDQVWDLRWTRGFTSAELATYDAFLEGGGRMYVASDHSGFPSGYSAIPGLVSAVGGGTVTLSGVTTGQNRTQNFTEAGALLNSPNTLASLWYSAGGNFASVTRGFLVTENAGTPGVGGLWAWDYGDLVGAAEARMLIGMDIDLFNDKNGKPWVENLAAFLGENGTPVPEPGVMGMMLAGAAALIGRRSRA